MKAPQPVKPGSTGCCWLSNGINFPRQSPATAACAAVVWVEGSELFGFMFKLLSKLWRAAEACKASRLGCCRWRLNPWCDYKGTARVDQWIVESKQ